MARFTTENVVEYLEGLPSILDEFIAEGSDDDLGMDDDVEGVVNIIINK